MPNFFYHHYKDSTKAGRLAAREEMIQFYCDTYEDFEREDREGAVYITFKDMNATNYRYKAVTFHGSSCMADGGSFPNPKQRALWIEDDYKDVSARLADKAANKGKKRELSGNAKAAADIRKVLKVKFPGVRFSVRSNYLRIDIEWTEGPCDDLVKFYASPLAANCDYVFTNREASDEFRKENPWHYDDDPAYYEKLFPAAVSEYKAAKAKKEAERKAEEEKIQEIYDKVHDWKKSHEAEIRSAMINPHEKGGMPYVLIHWSEHPAFCFAPDDSICMSLQDADRIIGELDKENHDHKDEEGWGGYDKLSFSIFDEKGEKVITKDRYDLGDGWCVNGRYGLLSFYIENYKWHVIHNDEPEYKYMHMTLDALNNYKEFVLWLKKILAPETPPEMPPENSKTSFTDCLPKSPEKDGKNPQENGGHAMNYLDHFLKDYADLKAKTAEIETFGRMAKEQFPKEFQKRFNEKYIHSVIHGAFHKEFPDLGDD